MTLELIKDIGEQGLLERLQPFCPPGVVGDDGAVIPPPESGQSLVITTDVLVNGVHFSDRYGGVSQCTTSPEDAGWRAAAANLSDLAAMGASPLGITVGLSLTGDVAVSWVERLYQGMTQCLNQYNTPIVGGDICRSPVITIAITAFGQVYPDQAIRRTGAKVGHAIVVTGVHGASRAGLELLLNPDFGKHLSPEERLSLIKAHQRPQPRLDVVSLLTLQVNRLKVESWNFQPDNFQPDNFQSDNFQPSTLQPSNLQPSNLQPSTLQPSTLQPSTLQLSIAGMDSSDGLADAIVQICGASGVGAEIDPNRITLPPSFSKLVSPEQALDWALYGGEDFELVLCLPTEAAEELVAQLGEGAAVIGKITSGNEVWLKDKTGTYADQLLSLNKGFQHF
ncbi:MULTISPECIES: thiamine-phosphate kinase [Moorena]|uniref:Thiamine-monophosphate kinase n=1 Tax=Moorena producens 3L TaxID=489825 RepID=F4Y071_9CYAN|nr:MULTISPECIES: thiamine-phosphate kinase [Moorena]NEQ12937.1 thiamine-phosphate kinase [Moorena sp. SIO3E2]EGJ29803.1 thiamine-phosphate kinase [Moorena producens 3L]NEP69749.1 thiamine-phosphate kinase [Moorena sp. SIO3A5]NEQ08778.1 thiamine-phosphate kinase [Moorena sp. SIO4E2]NER91862.1 thiamine-phosphate kinase [Moorena sp. SIO3A2]